MADKQYDRLFTSLWHAKKEEPEEEKRGSRSARSFVASLKEAIDQARGGEPPVPPTRFA
jgi:hypothetical protein